MAIESIKCKPLYIFQASGTDTPSEETTQSTEAEPAHLVTSDSAAPAVLSHGKGRGTRNRDNENHRDNWRHKDPKPEHAAKHSSRG